MMRLFSKWKRSPNFLQQNKWGHVERVLMTGGFLAFIFAVGFWNLLSSDQKFSEEENRVLTQKPALSVNAILSGEFMSDYETYLSDQFAGKVGWTTLKAKSEQWQGKHETNGIFIAKDQFLLEKFTGENQAFSQNLSYIKEFAEKDKERKASILLAPTSIEFYKEKLPLFAEVSSQQPVLGEAEEFLKGSVNFINVYQTMEAHKQEDIFFRTDHHWTMRGAYYAYTQAADVLGFKPYAIADFSSKEVSGTFLGTYASKVVGFPVQPDAIEVLYPKFPSDYVVTYEDTGKVLHSLYHPESLQKRDQYSFFLEGNHSLLTIHSQVKNGRKLAVIKDSYAHAFLPFLANHYEEIHVIDLRYFHRGLEAYLEKNNLNDILFLYNAPNFMMDANMIWLKS